MTFSTLEHHALHTVFSFAQADRAVDVRLVARLLMCSQRETLACLSRLAERGWVDAPSFAITPGGVDEVMRTRHRVRVEHGPRVVVSRAA